MSKREFKHFDIIEYVNNCTTYLRGVNNHKLIKGNRYLVLKNKSEVSGAEFSILPISDDNKKGVCISINTVCLVDSGDFKFIYNITDAVIPIFDKHEMLLMLHKANSPLDSKTNESIKGAYPGGVDIFIHDLNNSCGFMLGTQLFSRVEEVAKSMDVTLKNRLLDFNPFIKMSVPLCENAVNVYKECIMIGTVKFSKFIANYLEEAINVITIMNNSGSYFITQLNFLSLHDDTDNICLDVSYDCDKSEFYIKYRDKLLSTERTYAYGFTYIKDLLRQIRMAQKDLENKK